MNVITVEQLEAVAALIPEEQSRASRNGYHNGNGATFDIQIFVNEFVPEVGPPSAWNGGQRWRGKHGEPCPCGGGHDAGGFVILEFPSGAWTARCLHNSGSGFGPQDLRKRDPVYDPDRDRQSSGSGADGSESSSQFSSDEWPDPEEVGVEQLPVPNCAPAMLPECMRPFLTDIAERQQSPLEFSAVTLIVVAATVVGRKIGIRPKREDDWHVVVNLFGGLIGPPGIAMKSPSLHEALFPLNTAAQHRARLAHHAKR